MSGPPRTRLHYEIDTVAELLCASEAQYTARVAVAAEVRSLAQRLWGSSICAAIHGSTFSGVALHSSSLDIVVGGIQSLPSPDLPDGTGYLPQTRSTVAEYLTELQQCALSQELTIVLHYHLDRSHCNQRRVVARCFESCDANRFTRHRRWWYPVPAAS
jgi:hypothetical protein